MKAAELMIGDYVSVEPSGQRICIAAIHNGKVGYHTVEYRLEWVRMGLLRPIPLTEEGVRKKLRELYEAFIEEYLRKHRKKRIRKDLTYWW